MLSAHAPEAAPPEARWPPEPACLPQNSCSMPSARCIVMAGMARLSCWLPATALAEEHAIQTITFPSISTGAYGYPIRDAAQIALRETARHLRLETSRLSQVVFVLFSEADYRIYASSLDAM